MWFTRGQPIPTWPSGRGPKARVVIENADGAEAWLEERILHAAGYDVVTCSGPAGLRGRRCPVQGGDECPAVAEADAVVSSLRVENPVGREILTALRARYPRVPLVVEAPPAAAERFADALAGCTLVFPLTADRLAAALDEALALSSP